jgi:hypothetical protein
LFRANPLFCSTDVPVGEKNASDKESSERVGALDRNGDESWEDRGEREAGNNHESVRSGSTVHRRFEDKDITDLKMVR